MRETEVQILWLQLGESRFEMKVRLQNKNYSRFVVLLLSGALLVGCGGSDVSSEASAGETGIVSGTSTPEPGTTVTVTATVTETATETVTEPADPEEEDLPTGEPKPLEIRIGQKLTLSNIPDNYGDWEERTYDIADQVGVEGMGTMIGYCSDSSGLELRLGNKYKTLEFSVGQDNASETARQKVMLSVIGDSGQLLVNTVPWNEDRPFKVDVEASNAVTISISREEDNDGECYGTVTVVVHDMVLK